MGPNPIIWLILKVIEIYMFLVFAYVIMGWLVRFEVVNLRNQVAYLIYDTLHKLTEPALSRIRPYLPRMQIDISPLVLFFGLMFLQYSIVWFYNALT